ncbi:hypothetical protein D3C84_1080380 [compost metagenome]
MVISKVGPHNSPFSLSPVAFIMALSKLDPKVILISDWLSFPFTMTHPFGSAEMIVHFVLLDLKELL